MNKRQKGKYKLELDWNGRRHTEWYNDKSRAESRKNELESYRDDDSPNCSPFTNIKIQFVEENQLPLRYQSW